MLVGIDNNELLWDVTDPFSVAPPILNKNSNYVLFHRILSFIKIDGKGDKKDSHWKSQGALKKLNFLDNLGIGSIS